MKDGLFEVGDVIKGLPSNGYFVTNEKMTKAVVVSTDERTMLVRVLEHTENIKGNEEHYVENSTSIFELTEEIQKDFWETLEVL